MSPFAADPMPVRGSYCLRYIAGTDLRERKHPVTTVKFATWAEAEDHRLAQPDAVAVRLDVVERFGGGDGR